MAVMELDGILFRNLCKGGLDAIIRDEEKVNGLNVFPVPDGDTGTNMKLTLEHGILDSVDEESIGSFSKKLARGMLLGARGNSGVILSQIFKGISKHLKEFVKATPKDFANAIIKGYENAYSAVVHPVEGTILTVCRLGIENIKDEINDNTSFEELFDKFIKSMKEVLKKTPEMLPVLMDAGVIDSGGAGLIIIFEGMEGVLLGKEIPSLLEEKEYTKVKKDNGYSLEFILEFEDEKINNNPFDLDNFISCLNKLGNDLSYFKDESYIKVEIVSKNPGEVINEALKYGKFTSINMDVENSKKNVKKLPHKHLAYIAVGQGEGFIDLYKDFGCDIVIDGGKTMNTSSEEFLNAIEILDADDIIILPNNKNIILAAEQAAKINDSYNIHVLPTKSLVEGYFAFSLMDTVDEDIPASQQISNMMMGINQSHSFGVTMAVKDSKYKGIEINRGEYISILDGEIVYKSNSKQEAVIEGMKLIPDMDSKEIIILFTGKNLSLDEADTLIDELALIYPNAQTGIIEGNQDTYGVLLGIS